jgi:hypothetical protein
VTLPPEDEPVSGPEQDPGVDQAAVTAATRPPPDPAPPPSPPPAVSAMPGMRATVGRGLDLNVAASGEVRRASVYIGLLTLLSVGPIATVLWAFSARQGGFEWLQQLARGLSPDFVPVGPGFGELFFVILMIGFWCLLTVGVDAQLLATVLIGAKATERRFDLRAALALVRLRYWRFVRASALIGLILLIPRFLVNQVVMNGKPVGTEAQALFVSAIDILVSTPFAYVAAGIVLGAVAARESIRRSVRLAQARWRLALLIGIVNTAVTYIAGFAVGAGGDILVRLGTAFGLGASMGPAQIVVLAAIVALAIVSIGSLIMTIGALTVGPQIVAFLGLTGYSGGLDATRDPADPTAPPRVAPLISMPMQLAFVINAALATLALIFLLR